MPPLIAAGPVGRVTWLGTVPDRDRALASDARPRLILGYGGPLGEAHSGLTRPSCSRVRALYPRGTEIRNTRQLSIMSAEELARIAAEMELRDLDPAWLGTTMVLSGIPDLTHLPPASRLQFANGATLTVDLENLPCHLPVAVIDRARPGMGRRFKTAAAGRRGVTAWVEREGVVELGEAVGLFVPAQRAWRGLMSGESETSRDRKHEATDEAGMDEKARGGHGVSPVPSIGELSPLVKSSLAT